MAVEDDVIGLCPHCGTYLVWGRLDLEHEYRRDELAAACEGCAQEVDFVDSSPVPLALDRPRKGGVYE
ncbi:MAG: hypothetical protein HY330_01910 [Chloroflexi bacterium]|nr:hypothetical protein [Chloroflexota bacterium]